MATIGQLITENVTSLKVQKIKTCVIPLIILASKHKYSGIHIQLFKVKVIKMGLAWSSKLS